MTVALSRIFLIRWFNQIGISLSKIEDIGKGIALCALIKSIDNSFPKYKEDARNEQDYLYNLKLIQAYMDRRGIKLFFPVERMIHCKMQDNLEVAQWFYRFWEREVNVNKTNENSLGNEESVENKNYNLESNVYVRQNEQRSLNTKNYSSIDKSCYNSITEESGLDKVTLQSNLQYKPFRKFSDKSEASSASRDSALNEDYDEYIKGNDFQVDSVQKQDSLETSEKSKEDAAIAELQDLNLVDKKDLLVKEYLEKINDLQEQNKFKDEKIAKLKEIVRVFENERDYYFDKLVMIERLVKTEENIDEGVAKQLFSIMYEEEYQ